MAVHDLGSIAFPTLDEAQISRLADCAAAACKSYGDGQTLFAVGDRDFKFFVVKSGEVEIVDSSGDGPRRLTAHRKGQFTGDVSHLTGTAAVVSAVARGPCEVIEVSGESLRRVLNLCPDLCDVILQAFIARRQLLRQSPDFTGLRVIGSRYSADTHRIRDFLAKNQVPFTRVDLETDPEVDRLLKEFGVSEADTPVVACAHLLLLRNPSNRQLADAINIHQPPEQLVYDLAIVGAGPAGLAAAVYGASEGLQTVVLEQTAPGGQAGSSMRIENYLGFPTGITGDELAERAKIQAIRFGARLSVSSPVSRLEFDRTYPVLRLEDGDTVATKCLLIATGAEYRRLGVEGCERFEGTGVYYAATPNEAQLCRGARVVLVGGGNSAGQAAVYLAGHAGEVLLLLRGGDLYKGMSNYLARRIERTGNIRLLRNTTIRRMRGNGRLSAIDVVDQMTGAKHTVETPAVFSFIGAVPRTDWLPPEIERDAKGFVRTGPALARSPHWTARRHPFLLETSRPGVFAAGDVRSGSVKRVAAAVGEGAMAVQFAHEFLNEM
jgi:thioredoxin reductase (NADPH)